MLKFQVGEESSCCFFQLAACSLVTNLEEQLQWKNTFLSAFTLNHVDLMMPVFILKHSVCG